MKRLMLLLMLGMMACHTAKPTNWAAECATRFPPRTDTIRFSKEIVRRDTIGVPGLRVPYVVKTVCPPSDTVRVFETVGNVACPPSKIVTVTRFVRDSIVVHAANVAAEMSLKSDIDSLSFLDLRYQREAISLRRHNRSLRICAAIAWCVVALMGYFMYENWKKNH